MQIVTDAASVVGPWVYRQIGKIWLDDPAYGTALGWVNHAGVLVAGVTFTGFDGTTVWLDCAALPKARWADRRALWAVFNYAFEQLGCARASSLVPEDNVVARKFNEIAGLREEAVLKRAAPGGKDMIVYTQFAEDCRWLRR